MLRGRNRRSGWFLTEIQDQATEVPEEILQDAAIREAVECLEESAFTPAELETYDLFRAALQATTLDDFARALIKIPE